MIMSEDIQAVTFGLGAETFAVPVTYVREILDFRDIFQIPGGPDYLLGLTELRGEGVTTIDFRLRLGLPKSEPTPSTRVLVVEVPLEDRVLLLGLVVDYVLDVFLNYSTDGNAAVRGGNNLKAADFGMACWCSHGRERTHIDGIVGTTQLMLAYALDI